jgi:hypothetical protein
MEVDCRSRQDTLSCRARDDYALNMVTPDEFPTERRARAAAMSQVHGQPNSG